MIPDDGGPSAPALPPQAGPHERTLHDIYGFRTGLVDLTAGDWALTASGVRELAAEVRGVVRLLRGAPDAWSGPAAEAAYQSLGKLSDGLEVHAEDIDGIDKGLRAASTAASTARVDYVVSVRSIPLEVSESDYLRPPARHLAASPDLPPELDRAAHDRAVAAAKAEREAAAARVLTTFTDEMTDAAKKLPVEPSADQTVRSGSASGGGSAGGVGAVSTGGGGSVAPAGGGGGGGGGVTGGGGGGGVGSFPTPQDPDGPPTHLPPPNGPTSTTPATPTTPTVPPASPGSGVTLDGSGSGSTGPGGGAVPGSVGSAVGGATPPAGSGGGGTLAAGGAMLAGGGVAAMLGRRGVGGAAAVGGARPVPGAASGGGRVGSGPASAGPGRAASDAGGRGAVVGAAAPGGAGQRGAVGAAAHGAAGQRGMVGAATQGGVGQGGRGASRGGTSAPGARGGLRAGPAGGASPGGGGAGGAGAAGGRTGARGRDAPGEDADPLTTEDEEVWFEGEDEPTPPVWG